MRNNLPSGKTFRNTLRLSMDVGQLWKPPLQFGNAQSLKLERETACVCRQTEKSYHTLRKAHPACSSIMELRKSSGIKSSIRIVTSLLKGNYQSLTREKWQGSHFRENRCPFRP